MTKAHDNAMQGVAMMKAMIGELADDTSPTARLVRGTIECQIALTLANAACIDADCVGGKE